MDKRAILGLVNPPVVTFGYPVVLDLHGVPVLVVGAGPVAVRKIAGLVAAGADVRVVAPDIDEQLNTDGTAELRRAGTAELRRAGTAELRRAGTAELRRAGTAELRRAGTAELRRRRYETADLDGVRLVVTATGVAAVDAAVAADARARGIWVNAADQPVDCDFILPAIAREGPISVAVSTDGSSPALAARLRDRIATLLTPELATLAAELAAERSAIRASGGTTEGRDWSTRIDAVLGDDSMPAE